jgi:sortase (surface protein transpeptidase)
MKSISMKFMQKSFIASLALSFVLSFAVAAYLSSPFTVRVETVRAAADELPTEQIESATTSAAIPFSDLNIISIIEEPSELALAEVTTPGATTPPTPAPTTEAKPTSPSKSAQKVSNQSGHPVRLIIPSIGLNAPVESVGINEKGEMDVPDGSSTEVGWYKYGTIPGNVGSAVIDAHVYAAFDDLRYLKVGSEVYVENTDGKRLKFVVNDSRVYQLGELTSGMLFGKRDARRLNLITCAGEPTADGSTYTHRLVVYTTLVA